MSATMTTTRESCQCRAEGPWTGPPSQRRSPSRYRARAPFERAAVAFLNGGGGDYMPRRECYVAKVQGGLLCTFFDLFLGLALQRGDGRSRRREVLRHHRSVAARVRGEREDRRQRKDWRVAAAAGRLNGRVLARRCSTSGVA